jgi:hypothetical protein
MRRYAFIFLAGLGAIILLARVSFAETYLLGGAPYSSSFVASDTSGGARALFFPLGQQSSATFSHGNTYYYRFGDDFENDCGSYGEGLLSTSLQAFSTASYTLPTQGVEYFWTSGTHAASGSITFNNSNSTTGYSSSSYWMFDIECNSGAQNADDADSDGAYTTTSWGDTMYTGSPAMCLGDSAFDCESTLPESFYAQIENTSTLDLYSASSTGSDLLKTLPADWVIEVVTSTDVSGNPLMSGSDTWYGVMDPTDNVTGWMLESDGVNQYISSYDGGAQAAMEASSSDQIATGTASGDTGDYVLSAIDNYYNESTTVNSLYSNNDDTGVNANTATPPGGNLQSDISILDQRGYPEKVVLAIAALEDGGTGFNNQIVTRDYGHGIMQVTPSILYYEQHDGNDYSSTNDPRGIASGVTIPPCASYMTSTYTNCYADSGGGDGSDAHSYISDTSISGSPTFLQYTNTPQSIYANVKDGMQILASKYGTTEGYSTRVCDNYPDPVVISSTVDYATTTYSCTDEEIIDLTAAYNGSSSPYLSEVATALTDIGDYFPSVTSTDASTTDIINKLNVANYNSVYFALHSPGDLSVQDAHGHTIGVVNGVATDTFPFATYDPATKSGYIFFPQDSNLTYKVTGTGTGVYGLDIDITSGTQRIAFHRDENVPITPGEVHTYTINTNMIAQGKNGVTLKIDKKGNGIINETDQLGATMTSVIEPRSLPLPSIPFIPIKLPVPVKKKIPTPIFVNPINSTFTLPISTETFNSSTFHWDIASSTISTSSTK